MVVTPDVIRAVRARLGPVGVWMGSLALLDVPAEQRAARRVEELGYGSLWSGEAIIGKEAFAHQAALLAATERIVTATGIANVWSRHPAAMQGGAATLGAAWPGRFVLGVGISHAPMVESTGQHYARPLAHMTDYLSAMAAAQDHVPAPAVAVPTVVAALRPRMLALAAEVADGAHPYFVPVPHTASARAALGPDKLLVTEQAVLCSQDPTAARAAARAHMARYLQLPNYVENLRHLGYAADDVAGGGSDRLVDDIVAWGDEEAVAARVRAHLEQGADHVVVQPLGEAADALALLERLAPVLVPRAA